MKNDKPVRILVADDHKLFRSGIISLLDDERNIFLVGEAESGKELIEVYDKILPDLVLADISMPVITGLAAAKEIVKKHPGAKILFLSMHDSEEYIFQAFSVGGKGLISKNVMKDELLFAISEVKSGRSYFGRSITKESLNRIVSKYEAFLGKEPDYKIDLLTEQERKVLLLIAEGLTSIEIGDSLQISKRTVDTHRANLIKKLNLGSLPELLKFAFEFTSSKQIKNKKN